MDLIDRDELRTIVYTAGRCNGKVALVNAVSTIINSAQKIDAIPIEWIERWLLDRNGYLEHTTSEIIIKQMIDGWRAEQGETT
jgi:hypothetical protein